MKKLTGGLRRDTTPNDQPNNSWVDARNIVSRNKEQRIKNERGFDLITPINFPNKSVIGVIETNTRNVFFFATNNAAESEIGIVDEDNIYTPLIIDAVLNFDTAHPIQGTFQTKFNDNLIVAWTDSTNGKWNVYRILNLDCIPFGIEPDYSITPADIEKAKALLSLFPYIKSATLTDFEVLQSGGNLTTGVYYPIIGYQLADGSDTSWISIYNPISIVADNISAPSLQYDGDTGGLFTGKSLQIVFNDIDTNFKYLKFGYIKIENGVYSTYFVNYYLINGTTLTIDFTDAESTKTKITIDEVLIPNSVYPYGRTITSLLNKLFLGNVEKDPDFDYQPYANNIELKWIYEQDVKIHEPFVEEGFKKEKVIFFKKAFKSDEVYAIYIALRNKLNGQWTKAYTIPGRVLNVGDDTDISGTDVDIAELDPGNPVPKFRVLETAVVTTTTADPNKPANANNLEGDFGFWENEDEEYPNISSFDSSSIGGSDLRTQKVRHHKFPSQNLLINNQPLVDNNGFNYVINKDEATFNGTSLTGNLYSILLNPTTNDIGWLNNTLGNFSLVPDGSFLTFGFSVTHNQIFYFVKNKLKIKLHLKLIFAATPLGSTINFYVYRNGVVYLQTTSNIPAGGGAENIYAEFNIEDKFVTGSSSGSGYLENYTILMELVAGSSPDITASVGGLTIHDLERSTVETKVLGIKVSNVEIPTGLEDIYDEWGIFYAKRSSNNIRALGNDILKAKRLHTFDLMQKQVATKASYLKTQLMYFDNIAGDVINNFPYPEREITFDLTRTITPKVYHVRRFEYAGENTNLNGINNTGLASNIYIEAGKSLTTPYNLDELQDLIGKTNQILDLMIYRKNIYNSFQNQELIFTGQSFKITGSGVQADQKVYGGDIFNNSHGYLEGNLGVGNPGEQSVTVESASNIGLRMDDLELGKYYYPKHLGYETVKPTASFYGYNTDYSAVNDLQKVFPATYSDSCLVDISVFHERIAYSITESNESSKINWRVFKLNDYYEMPKNRGVIWNLLGNDRVLYIHHEYSLFIAQIKDRLNTSGEETFLGVSDLFDRPPEEVLPVKNGFAGNTSQFATIVCEAGYCFIDRQKGSVFIYNGKLNEITEEGNSNFWRENAQYSSPDIDNPFMGMGYIMSYDDVEKRLIITKKDTGLGAFPFTISFSIEDNQFVSFHDYLPHYMFSTRQGFYIIDNLSNELYKHNSQVSLAQYFDGDIFPSYIDVPFNESNESSKRLQSINWISRVVNSIGVILEDETLTQIMVYNSNQCSGLLDLVTNNLWFNKDARNVEETWGFNNFRDVLLDRTLPFLNKDGSIITSNINNNPIWFKKSVFLSKFAIVRFQYSNDNQNYLNIIKVGTNVNLSTR